MISHPYFCMVQNCQPPFEDVHLLYKYMALFLFLFDKFVKKRLGLVPLTLVTIDMLTQQKSKNPQTVLCFRTLRKYICSRFKIVTNMIDFSKFNNLVSVTAYFSDIENCRNAIIQSRWADGNVICPYCGGHHCVMRKDGRFRCKHCLRNFAVTVGTIFENSKLPLSIWFIKILCKETHKSLVCGRNCTLSFFYLTVIFYI